VPHFCVPRDAVFVAGRTKEYFGKMKRSLFHSALLVSFLAACAVEPPPPWSPPGPPPPPPPPPGAGAEPLPAPAKAAEPSPEELKKAEQAKRLQEDRAEWESDRKKELARWTPQMRAEVKELSEKAYPSGKAAIQAIMKGKHRRPDSVVRDKYRHPAETLEFFGFKPTMIVLDFGPGEGWYTELLAPALAKSGKYIATNTDPKGPADQRSTFYGQVFKFFVDAVPEAYGKVDTVIVDSKAPKLPQDGTVDLVIVMREVHGLISNGSFNAWLPEILHALKPKGVLGIEQHRAPPDANPTESSKKGYVPEKWLIEQIEAAGFKLAAKSEINANPKDTKDYEDGVWTLPPSLTKKDKDRDKYVAIGESDRMTLKFVKAPAKAGSAPKAEGDKGTGDPKADKATPKAEPKADPKADKAPAKAEPKSDKPPAKAEPKPTP
jgi:predicted methyltransferase